MGVVDVDADVDVVGMRTKRQDAKQMMMITMKILLMVVVVVVVEVVELCVGARHWGRLVPARLQGHVSLLLLFAVLAGNVLDAQLRVRKQPPWPLVGRRVD